MFEYWKEQGRQDSIRAEIDKRLNEATGYTDYGGSVFDRYNVEYAVETWPSVFQTVPTVYNGAYLELKDGYSEADETEREGAREFIKWAFDDSRYPIFDDWGFHEWEYKQMETEVEKWSGAYLLGELRTELARQTDWDTDLIPADVTKQADWDFFSEYVWDEDSVPYFEGASDLIFPDFDAEVIVGRILADYAANLVPTQETKLF